jgi:hypothetical protein
MLRCNREDGAINGAATWKKKRRNDYVLGGYVLFVIFDLSAEGKTFRVDFLESVLVSAHSTGVKVLYFDTDL